jgi:MGT family glycosyltransferase
LAKALFLSLPLHGHTNPSLPVVRALVERGDEVTYYSAAAFALKVEEAGALYRPYRNAFLADITNLPERIEELSWLLTRTTGDLLADELEAFSAEHPDYIITDSVAPWGHWVGEILGVPVVTSVSTFAINRHVLRYAVTHGARPKSVRLVWSKLKHIGKAVALVRRLRRVHGVKGPGITGLVFGRSDLNIVYTSREVQPCADTFDERFQFVGSSLAPRPDEPLPPVTEAPNVPLVYVSLGTIFNAAHEFYRACFRAFRDEPVRVIMSIGTNVSQAALGEPPPNFEVKRHVSQLDVLQRAHVFVTHGGMNSVSESLYHGVPVVVVPQMSEQAMVGRRVEELGAGMCLTPDQTTPEHLRASVNRLLGDGRFRRQAAVLGQSLRTAGGPARAAEVIQGFVKGR